MNPTQQPLLENSKYKDIQISFYKNCKEKDSTLISLHEMFELIATGKGIKNKILQLRKANTDNEVDRLKKQLPAVTLSGIFNEGRKLSNLSVTTGLMQIDIDKPTNKVELKEQLCKDKYSLAVFDSPTNTGIKAIVKIPPNTNTHKQAFAALEAFYKEKYNIVIDTSCKDITRLMFLSYDPDIYINYDSTLWPLAINELKVFDNMVKWLKNKGEVFSEGNRNNYLYKLSAACNRSGVSKAFTLSECISGFDWGDYDVKAIEKTIDSAYSNEVAYHTKENSIAPNETKNEKEKYNWIEIVMAFINERYHLRLNEVTLEIEYKNREGESPCEVLKESNLYIELLKSNIKFSQSNLTALLASDFIVKPYNPFLHYFENIGTWNAEKEPDYISQLSEYIPVSDKERFTKHFRKMFVRCIACALNDTVYNKQAFIFVHSQQNSGKSTFCRWLCPPTLSKYFTENISIDKDSLIALTQNFLINLDELATLSRAEINSLKSMFSQETVKVRAPYERKALPYPRRANFIGSTNKDEFLTDATGSVRFLCFELTGTLNFDYKKDINIDDIWRQAYTLYKQNFEYQLTVKEIEENERANQKFQVQTQEMQLVQKMFMPAKKDEFGAEFLNATEVHRELYTNNSFLKSTKEAVGRALKQLGFEQSSRYDERTAYSTKGYYLKRIQK